MLQQAEQNVVGHARTGMAEMGVAVDRRTADIHADMAFMDRLEQFLGAGEGIGQIEGSHIKKRVNYLRTRTWSLRAGFGAKEVSS